MKIHIEDKTEFVVGNNAVENWNVLMVAKKENQKYVWMHLENESSPYVIIKKELLKCTSQEIYLGADLCKQYSKLKKVPQTKIMYTSVNKVSKGKMVGQVHIKGKYLTVKI